MMLNKLVSLILAMLLLSSALLFIGSSSAGLTAPPNDLIDGLQYIDGPWIVSGYENYSNEIIILTGDLFVAPGGMLAFENVTLLMNCTISELQYAILVQEGGTFFVNDTDNNPATTYDRSVITNSELAAYGFEFQVNATGILEIRNSIVRNCGILTSGAGEPESGFLSLSDNTIIENCELYNSANGFVSDSAGFRMLNCSVHDNNFNGVLVLNDTQPSNQMDIVISGTTIIDNTDTGFIAYAGIIDLAMDNSTVKNHGEGGVLIEAHDTANITINDSFIQNNQNEGGVGVWGTSGNLVIRSEIHRNNISGNRGFSPIRLGFFFSEVPVHTVFLNASANNIWNAGGADGLIMVIAVERVQVNLTGNNIVSPSTQNGVHLGLLSKEISTHPATKHLRADIFNNEISNFASGALRICAMKSLFTNITGNHIYHPDGIMTCGSVTVGWFKAGTDDSTPENATVVAKNNLIEGILDTGGLGLKAIYNLNATIENNTIRNVSGAGIRIGWMDDSEYNDTPELWALPTRNVRAKICNNEIGKGRGPGIWLYSSAGSQVFDNNVSERSGDVTLTRLPGDGIRVQATSGNTEVFSNELFDNVGCAIRMYKSQGVSVHDNNLLANDFGLGVDYYSKQNHFYGNIISKLNNQYGYYIVRNSLNHSFPVNNTVNGAWLRYFFDVDGSPGALTPVQGHDIQEPLMSNLGQIVIANCSFLDILDNTAANGTSGIFLYNVHNSSIHDNYLLFNSLMLSNGLCLETDSTDNSVYSNSFIDNRYGIALMDRAVRNSLWDNTISKQDTQLGFFLDTDGTVWNNEIPINNTVSGTQFRYYYDVQPTLSNFTVTTKFMSNLGQLLIVDCQDAQIDNITLSGGLLGLYLNGVNNITLVNMRISENTKNIYATSSSNISLSSSTLSLGQRNVELRYVDAIQINEVTLENGTNSLYLFESHASIINSTIHGSTLNSVNISQHSHLDLINTTFNNSLVTSNSTLTVSWYLHVSARCNNQSVEGANVSLFNTSGDLMKWGVTGQDGRILNLVIEEFFQDMNGTYYLAPYDLSVQRTGMGSFSEMVQMNASTSVDATLDDTILPIISMGPEFEPGNLSISLDMVWLNATIVDPGQCPGIVAQAEWFVSDSTPQIINGTGFPMVSVDGALDESNESVSAAIDIDQYGKGQHTFWVHGSDSSGNWLDWSPLTVSVSDDMGPVITGPVTITPTDISTEITSIWVTATFDDSGRGDSPIDSIRCQVLNHSIFSDLSVLSMTPQDGILNEANETVISRFDISLLSAGIHTLIISAADDLGNWGPGFNFTIEVKDGEAPARPEGLAAINLEENGQIRLVWIPNSEIDLAGYNIYRTTWSGSNYELVATVDANITSWEDTGLTNGRIYYYSITAFDNATPPNESPRSAEASVTPTGADANSYDITWVLILVPLLIVVLVSYLLFSKGRKVNQSRAKKEPQEELIDEDENVID